MTACKNKNDIFGDLMKIIHNSRDSRYRSPFGAVTVGTEVDIAIEFEDCMPESVQLLMRRDEEAAPAVLTMRECSAERKNTYEGTDSGSIIRRYEASFTAPETGGLLWYYFSAEFCDDEDDDNQRYILYYGNNNEMLGGEGEVYFDRDAEAGGIPFFQITVYKESRVPEWYRDGIVYQIFPGRFSRDDDWRERCEAACRELNSRRYDTKRIIQEDWNKAAYYGRDGAGRVTEWPLYGGSLKGIEEKLDYLRSLGVTAIYLNPVFKSASNHHYDTADYMKIDPSLGTNDDFASLAKEAKARGIRLILDGVFSHTGADSIYFDIYDTYNSRESEGQPVRGAYKHEDSPFRSWFKFDENEACGYSSWWGVADLPEVDENNPDYRKFILGKDGVIDYWMKLGASGWRLDVADELPDSFIEETRRTIKAADPDGLLIGEVWEDASNKISYGERRKYFMGDELDGTMNYPLRDILLDYINYTIGSDYAGRRLMSLKENYPEENFYGALNLIGSHDRERIITAMAAKEDYKSAVSKVRVLSSLEYTLPGVPCIYYGDEAGLMGGRDPENRSGFPWGYENLDLGYHYRMLGLIYDEHPVLKGGDFLMLSGREGIGEDIFAFIRGESRPDGITAGAETEERILVLANRSYGPVKADLSEIAETKCGYALELLTSEEMTPDGNGSLGVVELEPLSVKIICLLDRQPAAEDLGRKAGVICHISSLGTPVLGTPAKEFADYLASSGMKIWQVLPLNPTGTGGSPYSSYASFAGYPALINRDELPDHSGYEEFCRNNMGWLCEYVVYKLLKELHDEKPWYEWPDEYKFGDPEKLAGSLSKVHGARMDALAKDQYYFYVQWNELKEYCNGLGISLMGDLPMYMAKDSADVWGNKDLFRLDEHGVQKVHAGVPPDAFSEDGQDWGNPLYDWELQRATGYKWWLGRLRQCAERFDILRIDHFRGFSEYFAIPEGESPKKGSWQHSAGLGFFRAVSDMLREEGLGMKLLAEDLGFLDAGVKNLLKLTGLPGMDIWQFTHDEMMSMDPEKASMRAFYTGTHDNDTLAGFVRKAAGNAEGHGTSGDMTSGTPAEREPDPSVEKKCLDIITRIYESPSALAMIQVQDMFILGSEARINVPGIAEGNWTWKMPGKSVHDSYKDAEERAAWFRALAEKTDR